MANVLRLGLRLAVETDLPAVIELSKDIYGGHDFLVHKYNDFLKDKNRRILIAEKDYKAVSLQVIHIIDGGETANPHSLRVHPKYQRQGIAQWFTLAGRDYLKENFPQVKRERVSVGVPGSEAMLGIKKKLGDVLLHKMAYFQCFVNGNALQFSSRLARYTSELYNQWLYTTTKLEHLSTTEFENVLKEGKLENILFKGIYVIYWQPLKALVSNIPNGLMEEGDSFFASFSGESVESLSHSRWYPIAKCPQLITVCYTLDEELLKAHIVKQLESAMLQHPGEMFTFFCFMDTSLVDCASQLLLNDLSLMNYLEDSTKPYSVNYFFEKSLV